MCIIIKSVYKKIETDDIVSFVNKTNLFNVVFKETNIALITMLFLVLKFTFGKLIKIIN